MAFALSPVARARARHSALTTWSSQLCERLVRQLARRNGCQRLVEHLLRCRTLHHHCSNAAGKGDATSGDSRRWTAFARRFPSWHEHGGAAIFSVGILNGCLVVTGFAITWLSTLKRYELDLKAQRLQSELKRTDQQLEELFGPLRAITHATAAGFASFVAEHSMENSKDPWDVGGFRAAVSQEAPLSEASLENLIRSRPCGLEGKRYRQLIACTLQPLNRRAMETVLSRTHLIDGEFPDCLYRLYAHVIEMDSLLERWVLRDFAVMFPPTPYPMEVNRWAVLEFERLRKKQKALMRELGG